MQSLGGFGRSIRGALGRALGAPIIASVRPSLTHWAMLLSPRIMPAAMMCPMDPAARTSTKVIPIGSPLSMSAPLSSRFKPFPRLACLFVPGAQPFLTAKSMMKVAVQTAWTGRKGEGRGADETRRGEAREEVSTDPIQAGGVGGSSN